MAVEKESLQSSETNDAKREKVRVIPIRYAIVINTNFSEAQKASVLLHEIGHILCGHVGRDKNNKLVSVPDRENENLTENTKEYEAEKVCEIVSKMLGIDNNSNYI